MAPSQSFTGFATALTATNNYGSGIGEVSGTVNGVTFTLSQTGGFSPGWGLGLLPSQLSVNQTGAGVQYFLLTWTNGAGGSQANSISIDFTGSDPSEIYFVKNSTTASTTEAQDKLVYNSGQVVGISFVLNADSDQAIILSLKMSINCFTAGTMISTPNGARAVETLVAGDVILNSEGRVSTVKWLGAQDVNTRFTDPKKVNPICITAGALGNGLPLRDLKVSGDHAIAIEGVLYNASTLVNGTTIYQVAQMPLNGFTYYHVETDAHELLLAEGVSAETFIDYAGRDSFENGDEVTGQVAEMALPRISSARMVPSELQTRLNENKQSRSVA